ncbi:MAG: insulinase family protein [Opitutus sp.]
MYLARRWVGLGLFFVASLTHAQTPPVVVAPDIVVHSGELANGLRYVVVPSSSLKGDIGLRLLVHAGSLDERDDQRGFAHFVEHMAFNGTRHHPPGTVRQLFQTLGMRSGADLNANTGYTFTSYLLDLPADRTGELDRGLELMRDYADGILFPPDEVARESRVVLSELSMRDDARQRVNNQLLALIYAGTSLPRRSVGGEPQQLERATADDLRAFYQQHYRPERMTVVLVGPIDEEAAVKKINAAFGSMVASSTPSAPAPVPAPPEFAGVKAETVETPSAKGSDIQLFHIARRPPDSVEGRRQELVQRLATAALSSRVRARRERVDLTHLGPPRVTFQPLPFGPYVQHGLEQGTGPEDWRQAVDLLESELRRAQSVGFAKSEIDEAAAGQLTHVQNRVVDLPGRSASQLAEEISREIMTGRTWQPPKVALREEGIAIRSIDAAEVTAELGRMFPQNSLHLILLSAPGNAVKPDRLAAAYQKSSQRNVAGSSTAEKTLKFQYQTFGDPAAVARSEHVADLDLTLAAFANGARINIRPTAFEPERFRMRVVFPHNYSDVPAEYGGIAELAGQLLLSSNLRRQSQLEITRLLRLRGLEPQFNVQNGTPVFTVTGPARELEFSFQFLTAVLSDLALDQEHYQVALSSYAGQHQAMATSSSLLGLRAALMAYSGEDRRVALNPPQLFANDAAREKTERWLRNYILTSALEIGVVGDVAVADVLRFAGATVGTLPARNDIKHGRPLAIPSKPLRVEGSWELQASTSLSCLLWPVLLPDEPKSNAALALATDIVRDRATLVLRETLGANYANDARVFRDAVQRDFAFVGMVTPFDPAKSRELSALGLAIAADLAKQGVSQEEFDRLKGPARTQRAQDLRNNGWWVNLIASAQRRPDVLDEIRQHATILETLTKADVDAAAQTFKPDRFTWVLLHPASAKIAPIKPAEKKKAKTKS